MSNLREPRYGNGNVRMIRDLWVPADLAARILTAMPPRTSPEVAGELVRTVYQPAPIARPEQPEEMKPARVTRVVSKRKPARPAQNSEMAPAGLPSAALEPAASAEQAGTLVSAEVAPLSPAEPTPAERPVHAAAIRAEKPVAAASVVALFRQYSAAPKPAPKVAPRISIGQPSARKTAPVVGWVEQRQERVRAARDYLRGRGFNVDPANTYGQWIVSGWHGSIGEQDLIGLAVEKGMAA